MLEGFLPQVIFEGLPRAVSGVEDGEKLIFRKKGVVDMVEAFIALVDIDRKGGESSCYRSNIVTQLVKDGEFSR